MTLLLLALLAAPAARAAAAGQEADTAAAGDPVRPRGAQPAVSAEPGARPDLTADSAAALAVVTGFRGYAWGTPPSAIPEIADERPGRAPNGMTAYGIPSSLLGYRGTAFFLFDPATDELIEGIYVFPIATDECDRAWEAFEKQLVDDHPALRVERVKTEWEGEERGVYDSFCEFFVFNPSATNWITRLRNDATGLVELGMAIRPQALEPRLSVLYVSPRAARWEAARATGGGPDTADADSAAARADSVPAGEDSARGRAPAGRP